jgi:hypothetical protein
MARQRGSERRDSGHGSLFYDETKGRWIGQLPRDEFGRRPKVSGATESEAQGKLNDKLRERQQRARVGRSYDDEAGSRIVGARHADGV